MLIVISFSKSCTVAAAACNTTTDFLSWLASAVSLRGLTSFEYSDAWGERWMEIRPRPSATFRVPFYGYQTHPLRLIVNQHLSYWLEAMGHCIRSGTFRRSTINATAIHPQFDVYTVQSVLHLLAGGANICKGVHSDDSSLMHPHHQQMAAIDDNYLTLPDYRYRSYHCYWLVDASPGSGQTQCPSCLSISTHQSNPKADATSLGKAFSQPHVYRY